MVRWLAVTLTFSTLQAAAIRGIVLDNQSGRPLARTMVQLEVVKGEVRGKPVARTDTNGVFTFTAPAGSYLLAATRQGYVPVRYGQKRWNAPGKPIEVKEDDLMLELRMRRLGGISGTVEDENQIGLPDQDVVAYKATHPPKIVGRARTDDLGYFRIGRLEPGLYYIRSAPRMLEDGTGLLPTFHKEALPVHEAVPVQTYLDETSREVTIRPLPGRLHRLAGRVVSFPPVPVTVRLTSDIGERVTAATRDGYFRFDELAPGEYEILAYASDPNQPAGADYVRFHLGGDMSNMMLQLKPFPTVRVSIRTLEGSDRPDQSNVQVIARRKDLSGEGPPQPVDSARAQYPPGRWEFTVRTSANYCPVQLYTMRSRGLGDTWVAAVLDSGPNFLEVTVSNRPAALLGKVLDARNEAVAGVPVYAERYERDNHRRAGEVRTARTDARGEYRFEGLVPGHYRLVSTFDFDEPDEETMEAARPATITVKEAERSALDLKLYDIE